LKSHHKSGLTLAFFSAFLLIQNALIDSVWLAGWLDSIRLTNWEELEISGFLQFCDSVGHGGVPTTKKFWPGPPLGPGTWGAKHLYDKFSKYGIGTFRRSHFAGFHFAGVRFAGPHFAGGTLRRWYTSPGGTFRREVHFAGHIKLSIKPGNRSKRFFKILGNFLKIDLAKEKKILELTKFLFYKICILIFLIRCSDRFYTL
jgi:hypothetical protein